MDNLPEVILFSEQLLRLAVAAAETDRDQIPQKTGDLAVREAAAVFHLMAVVLGPAVQAHLGKATQAEHFQTLKAEAVVVLEQQAQQV
jgi:hypothetical protein